MIAVLGAAGFVGAETVRQLVRAGKRTCATLSRQSAATRTVGEGELPIDLSTESSRLAEWLRTKHVSRLIHAAFPARALLSSAIDEVETGARNIDEAVIDACRHCPSLRTVVLVSSGAVYGDRRGSGVPAVEGQIPAPSGRYGEIKLAQEQRWIDAALDLDLVLARPFNITGPGEPTTLVAAMFAQRMAHSPHGPFEVRNSESVRDFVDVRDVASALAHLVTQPAGAYNIASSVSTSVRDLASQLAEIGHVPIEIEPDGRGAESWSCGDSVKLTTATGWRRRYSLHDSLDAVWMERSTRVSVQRASATSELRRFAS